MNQAQLTQQILGSIEHLRPPPALPDSGDLVGRVIRKLARRAGRAYLWAEVSEWFALGSESSKRLCRVHGIDPDTMVKRFRR